jgi:hypothetical protein
MSAQGAMALSASLSALLNLTQLDLVPGFYDESGLSDLCPALQRLTNLERLVLACSIDLQVLSKQQLFPQTDSENSVESEPDTAVPSNLILLYHHI